MSILIIRFKKGGIIEMKRLLITMLCLLCMIANSFIAFAEELQEIKVIDLESSTTIVYEYDIYSDEIKSLSKRAVFDSKAKEMINSIENAVSSNIVDLALLTEQELLNKGYDMDQVFIIKNYKGGSLLDNEQLRSVLSVLSITANPSVAVYTHNISAAYFKLAITWTWSSKPLLCGPLVEDGVGVIWQAANSSGQFVAARINTSESYCHTYYYNDSGVMQTYSTSTLTVVEQLRAAKAKINMGIWNSNNTDTYWAKSGTIMLRTDADGSTPYLYDMEYKFAYGHANISVDPKVTVSFSLTNPQQWNVLGSITFTKGQKMTEKCFYVDTNNQTVVYY